MVYDDPKDARFSQITLAVLADSGWYDVDFMEGDQYDWGKGKGCAMFSEECKWDELTEFCLQRDSTTCSDNFKYIAGCHRTGVSPDCNLNLNVRSCKKQRQSHIKSFTYGQNSVCLPSIVSKSPNC